MDNERELELAIDEYLSSELNPQRSIKLASYITVLNHIRKNSESKERKMQSSVRTGMNGFVADELNGKDSEKLWELVVELLETLRLTNLPLFNATMKRIKNL